MVNVRTLFNCEHDFCNKVRNKKTKHKASDNNQALVPTIDNLFHCYQNEVELKRINRKHSIIVKNQKRLIVHVTLTDSIKLK